MLGQYSIAEAPIAALPTFVAPTVFRDVNAPFKLDANLNRSSLNVAPAQTLLDVGKINSFVNIAGSETFIDLIREYTFLDVEQ